MSKFHRFVTRAAAGLALAAAAGAASAATITVASTVDQSGFFGTQDAASYPLTGATPYTFTGQVNSFANVTSIDSITVQLTSILDGDTGAGDYDFDSLTLGLDGIDTGLKLNGLANNGISTINLTQLNPTLQAQLIAQLQDGQFVGSILDATPGNSTPGGDIISIPTMLETTLELTLTGAALNTPGNPGGPGGQVPLPAGVLLAPVGVAAAGAWKRRFRKAE